MVLRMLRRRLAVIVRERVRLCSERVVGLDLGHGRTAIAMAVWCGDSTDVLGSADFGQLDAIRLLSE